MISKNITVDNLYRLFFEKDLLILSKPPPIPTTSYQSPVKKKRKLSTEEMTPLTKIVYEYTTPKSRKRMLEYLQKDIMAEKEEEKKEEEIDPDYQEKMENSGLGFFMEDIISYEGLCPVCGKNTLHKYINSNMPVVDMVCTNKDYHLGQNKCFLFQVKISVTKHYFDLNARTISIGSKKYGEPAHLVKGNQDMHRKRIVPGYICIKLNPVRNQGQQYHVDARNSFVIIPNYQNTTDNYYYQYASNLDPYGKNIIIWNSQMFETRNASTVITRQSISHDIFFGTAIENPYQSLINPALTGNRRQG